MLLKLINKMFERYRSIKLTSIILILSFLIFSNLKDDGFDQDDRLIIFYEKCNCLSNVLLPCHHQNRRGFN